jgi:hypothetical protein
LAATPVPHVEQYDALERIDSRSMRSFYILKGMPHMLAANPTEGIRMADATKKTKITAKTRKPAIKKENVARTAKSVKPSREEIERLAKSYWVARGCKDGDAEQDWLRAEQELLKMAS